MPYRDLREYLSRLEKEDLLYWVDKEVDRDWEISCINRSVFQGLPEPAVGKGTGKRYALGFRRIKNFPGFSFVVGVVGNSRHHIAAAIESPVDDGAILRKMSDALAQPIPPRIVSDGPCKEVVLHGEEVDLRRFPAIVWTPGKDAGPYFTPMWFTRDPDTGRRNLGIYRSQLKGADRLAIWTYQDAYRNMSRWFARGESCPAALVIGADPTLYLMAGAKAPYGYDEIAGAGGLRGEPVELVKCDTIDLEVPATAEIVLEGEFSPNDREQEGPFGEFTGYMAASPVPMPVFRVKHITHRRNPIVQGLTAQFPLSESSILRQASREACVFKHLRHDLLFDWVIDYHLTIPGGSLAWSWVKIRKTSAIQVERVVAGIIACLGTGAGKWIVVCDDDVEIRDPFAREWVLAYSVRPSQDIRLIGPVEAMALDPSAAPAEEVERSSRAGLTSSRVIIDATRKWKYPEISMPPREMLDRARARWQEYGLPPVGEPWFPFRHS